MTGRGRAGLPTRAAAAKLQETARLSEACHETASCSLTPKDTPKTVRHNVVEAALDTEDDETMDEDSAERTFVQQFGLISGVPKWTKATKQLQLMNAWDVKYNHLMKKLFGKKKLTQAHVVAELKPGLQYLRDLLKDKHACQCVLAAVEIFAFVKLASERYPSDNNIKEFFNDIVNEGTMRGVNGLNPKTTNQGSQFSKSAIKSMRKHCATLKQAMDEHPDWSEYRMELDLRWDSESDSESDSEMAEKSVSYWSQNSVLEGIPVLTSAIYTIGVAQTWSDKCPFMFDDYPTGQEELDDLYYSALHTFSPYHCARDSWHKSGFTEYYYIVWFYGSYSPFRTKQQVTKDFEPTDEYMQKYDGKYPHPVYWAPGETEDSSEEEEEVSDLKDDVFQETVQVTEVSVSPPRKRKERDQTRPDEDQVDCPFEDCPHPIFYATPEQCDGLVNGRGEVDFEVKWDLRGHPSKGTWVEKLGQARVHYGIHHHGSELPTALVWERFPNMKNFFIRIYNYKHKEPPLEEDNGCYIKLKQMKNIKKIFQRANEKNTFILNLKATAYLADEYMKRLIEGVINEHVACPDMPKEAWLESGF